MVSLLMSVMVCNANPELLRTWNAICMVESGGDPCAVNAKENAVGIAQIRPVMVKDVNRICGKERFKLSDRTDPAKSFEMFRIHSLHYYPKGTPEQWARAWNGGAKGPKKPATAAYWKKIKAIMEAKP